MRENFEEQAYYELSLIADEAAWREHKNKFITASLTQAADWNQITPLSTIFQWFISLGYADDAALVDESPENATRRVTNIAQGSRTDADMIISIDKTQCMHVCDQGEPEKVTAAEAAKEAEFKCPHVGCNFKFRNKHK